MRTAVTAMLVLIFSFSVHASDFHSYQIVEAYKKIENTINAEKLSESKQKEAWVNFLNLYGDGQHYSDDLNQLKSYAEETAGLIDPVTGIEFVFIKGGCYLRQYDLDTHKLCVDDYYIGKYEVTQGQWNAIMDYNPSMAKACGKDCPVENISWQNIGDFVSKLNNRSKLGLRVASEYEWEYAAIGGEDHKYSGSDNLDDVGWYKGNSGGHIHPVGQKKPNNYGVYDMSGNVYELMDNLFARDMRKYTSLPNQTYKGERIITHVSLRGGSYNATSDKAVTTVISFATDDADGKYDDVGFRLAHNAK